MLHKSLILLAPDAPASAASPPEKPATAAIPAPAAPAAAPPSPAPQDDAKDILADLDKAYDKAGAEPVTKPAAAAPAAAPAAARPTAPPAATKPAKDDKPTAPQPPKELRAELDRVKAEFEQHKAGTAQLEAKIKDYEAKNKDTEALHNRLEQRNKEYEALQGELRALKQEASPEFQKQYDQPFAQAAKWAEEYVNRLAKTDGTPANFQRDFVPLFQLARNSTIGAARAKAEEMFDTRDVPEVMDSVKELVRLHKVRDSAFEEEKKVWKQREDEAAANKVQNDFRMEAFKKQEREMFDKVNADIRGTVDGFQVPVDDKELVGLQTTGEQQFEAIISRKPKDLQQKLVWGAHLKQRYAAFEPNQLTIKRQAARIAELEAKLSDATPRPPGPGDGHARPGGAETAKADDTIEGWKRGAEAAVQAAR